MLITDGYKWDDSLTLLETITKACKILNDTVYNRFPIHIALLEMILFEIQRMFLKDLYLEIMYKTLFIISYYGMLRISEITTDTSPHALDHAIKAVNVHVGQNKPKMLLVLYSSKTHNKEFRPQKVKISAMDQIQYLRKKRHFCPFNLLHQYIMLRGEINDENENLFVFRHKVVIPPATIRRTLKTAIRQIGVDETVFNFHSCFSDLFNSLNSLNSCSI